MNGTVEECLREGIAALGLEGNIVSAGGIDRRVKLLERYVDVLHRDSREYGLISVSDAEDRTVLAVRHVLDSVAGAYVLVSSLEQTPAHTVFDIGSGAGLPGIPLAVVLEDLPAQFVLVERSEKRVRFLNALMAEGDSPVPSRVSVLQADAERPSRETAAVFRREPSPVVVFRAYRKISPPLMRRLAQVFPPGTRYIAWKGRREAAWEDAEVIRSVPGFRIRDVHAVRVPFLDRERTLLTFDRI